MYWNLLIALLGTAPVQGRTSLTTYSGNCATPTPGVSASLRPDSQPIGLVGHAEDFVRNVAAGRVDSVTRWLNRDMESRCPATQVVAEWKDATKSVGQLSRFGSNYLMVAPGRGAAQTVMLQVLCANGVLEASITFEPNGQISGVSFAPR